MLRLQIVLSKLVAGKRIHEQKCGFINMKGDGVTAQLYKIGHSKNNVVSEHNTNHMKCPVY